MDATTHAVRLAKVAFMITNITAFHRAALPPNPYASLNDTEKYQNREDISGDTLSSFSKIIVPLRLLTGLAFGTCDVYVTLSAYYPSLQIPALHAVLLPPAARPPSPASFHLSYAFVCASLFIWTGTYLRVLCFRALGQQFTFELSFKKNHKLVTTGPYTVVRHPSYLGVLVIAAPLMFTQFFSRGTWWWECGMWRTGRGQLFGAYWVAFSVYTCLAVISRTAKEDAVLRAEFGKDWANWAKKTPYILIPYVW